MNGKRDWKTIVLSIIMLTTIILPCVVVHADTSMTQTASEAVVDMGTGWNLGNALDSSDYKVYDAETAALKKGNYQMLTSYQTKTYSGWDASSPTNFSQSSTKSTLKWNISSLKSTLSKKSGKFSFTIMNSAIADTGSNKIKFKITTAQFKTAKGKVLKLSKLLGTYEKKIVNGKTAVITTDLTKNTVLKKTSDLIGGTLTIAVTILKYPKPLNWVTNETYYETLWGNPVTTNAMMKSIKGAGFNAVRIPITYYDHMDKDGNIDKEWLTRVKKVVDYVVNNDMYCIINLHHDTGIRAWIKADATVYDATAKKFTNVWKQIATIFKKYDSKLLFEGYNEILNQSNQWSNASTADYQTANALNQVFVDTVRATGGNNASRNLIVTTYAAGVEESNLKAFVLPKDTVENHLIAEVHSYAPKVFAWNQGSVSWAKTRSTWDSTADVKEVTAIFDNLNTYLVSKGIPVIVGEFGAWNKNNSSDRMLYINCYLENARKYNISCFWWDAGGNFSSSSTVNTGALLNRKNSNWYFNDIIEGIMQK